MGFQYSAQDISSDVTPLMRCSSSVRPLTGRCRRKGPAGRLSSRPKADRTRSLRASVHNRGFTLFGFSPELVVVNEERETNAQLYDFQRTRGELRFVRQF